MTRQYSPKNFLRKTPNTLLKKYFDSKEVLQQIAWGELKETDTEPIIEALQELSNDDRTSIEQEFRDINEQACEAGVRVLLEEEGSDFHNLHLGDTFEQMSSHYERACWMFLNHRNVFAIAGNLAYIDSLSS